VWSSGPTRGKWLSGQANNFDIFQLFWRRTGLPALIANDFQILSFGCGKTESTDTLFLIIPVTS